MQPTYLPFLEKQGYDFTLGDGGCHSFPWGLIPTARHLCLEPMGNTFISLLLVKFSSRFRGQLKSFLTPNKAGLHNRESLHPICLCWVVKCNEDSVRRKLKSNGTEFYCYRHVINPCQWQSSIVKNNHVNMIKEPPQSTASISDVQVAVREPCLVTPWLWEAEGLFLSLGCLTSLLKDTDAEILLNLGYSGNFQ